MDYYSKIKSILFGIAVGDAIGVPVEFKSREYLIKYPVNDMIGYGTYNKPPGTFSDDTSLTFALVESLIEGYDLNDIAQNMVKWYDEAFWTADGDVFDVGRTTSSSIDNIKNNIEPSLSGESHEYSNGNGSLMRIAPLVFILISKPIDKRFQITKEVSSITHGHIRSIIGCFYFLEFLRYLLLNNLEKYEIYHKLQVEIPEFLSKYLKETGLGLNELSYFDRLLEENIYELSVEDISSSGYVVDTIEAVIWCFLNTNDFKEAVLKAVNLGEDSDTIASITGALMGLSHGFDNIPTKWVKMLAKSDEIDNLAIRFANSLE